jgi:Fe-S-cluster containining protein
MIPVIKEEKSWYAEGLRFKCTGCGQCCTGFPGYVWVSEEEIVAISKYLNLSIQEFSERFLHCVEGRFSLLEHPKTYDCIFLKDKKCQIYPVRPKQCRTFPWWTQNLKSEKEWEEAALHCEGINLNAPLVPYMEITEQLTLYEGK